MDYVEDKIIVNMHAYALSGMWQEIIACVILFLWSYIEAKKDNKAIVNSIEVNKLKAVPSWLEINKDRTEVKVLRKPTRDDVDLEVQESLIVELYSKN